MSEAEFNEMIVRYERLVYTICYQFTHNHHTAQDLAQDTFVSAFTHLEACPADCAKPWLARIATNKAKDFLKSAGHRKIAPQEDEALQEAKTAMFITETRPEDSIVQNETLDIVCGEVAALRAPYNQVAQLFFMDGQSVREISQWLDRPQKTVQTQIYRAKLQLRQKLAQQGYAPVAS